LPSEERREEEKKRLERKRENYFSLSARLERRDEKKTENWSTLAFTSKKKKKRGHRSFSHFLFFFSSFKKNMYAKPLSHAEALGPGCAGPALALPPSAADAMTMNGAGGGASSSMQRPTSGAAAFAVSPHEVASSDDPRQRTQ
jgi:hypothetical protein